MNRHISYHILVDDLSEYDLNMIILHLIKIKPDYITVKGGERFERAMWFVEQMYNRLPSCKIILRKWPDDGILKKFNYNVQLWFNTIINPYHQWLKKYNNVIWLLDNESAEYNLTQYAQATSEAMELCGKMGIALAVGRFAAGNPKEHQYAELDPMWKSLKKWWNLHIWSPNEYFEKPDNTGGSGSIFRYYNGWKRCKDRFNFIPKTVIGEFGLAVNYLSDKGFKSIGLEEREYFTICHRYFRTYYAPYNVPICLFSVGKWNGFEISDTFFVQNENNPIEVAMIEKPYVLEKETLPIYAVAIDNGIRIRDKAVVGKVIGHAYKHDTLLVLDEPSLIGKENTWIKVQFGNKVGYTASWFYVRSSCANDNLSIQISEENMSPVLQAILNIFSTILQSRTLMIPLIGAIVALFINAHPDLGLDAAVWTERIFALILLLLGGNEITHIAHAAKGKTYNKQTKEWE